MIAVHQVCLAIILPDSKELQQESDLMLSQLQTNIFNLRCSLPFLRAEHIQDQEEITVFCNQSVFRQPLCSIAGPEGFLYIFSFNKNFIPSCIYICSNLEDDATRILFNS